MALKRIGDLSARERACLLHTNCTTIPKARRRLEAEENLPAFRDQIILSALPDLSRSLFQKESFSELSVKEKAEFMRQIRFRFSADVNQIARVCGVSYADAAKMMDSTY